MFSFLAKSSTIRLVPLSLGPRAIRIPVADISGKTNGKTLLITAGMDGDEYAGIEAAYQLIETYKEGNFSGRLVIIPLVNVPGFEGEMSRNPLDNRFPKFIFPGSSSGSPTERLVAWLVKTYAVQANLWYDLHGGALSEHMKPFLWTYQTSIRETDGVLARLERETGAPLIVAEPADRWSKAGQLARRGCAYALTESGERGERNVTDIERHVAWAEGAMRALGLLPSAVQPSNLPPKRFTRVSYVSAPFDGIWRPTEAWRASTTTPNNTIGHCVRLDGTDKREFPAPPTGELLWWKETMSLRRGDTLAAFGHEK